MRYSRDDHRLHSVVMENKFFLASSVAAHLILVEVAFARQVKVSAFCETAQDVKRLVNTLQGASREIWGACHHLQRTILDIY